MLTKVTVTVSRCGRGEESQKWLSRTTTPGEYDNNKGRLHHELFPDIVDSKVITSIDNNRNLPLLDKYFNQDK